MQNDEISLILLENALNDKKLTIDAIINILKFKSVVDLTSLHDESLDNNILTLVFKSEKLWSTKVKYIEQQVGFNLDSYIHFFDDNPLKLFLELGNIIFFIQKCFKLLTYCIYNGVDDYKEDVMNLIYKCSKSGIIGLVAALGYINKYQDHNLIDYFYYDYADHLNDDAQSSSDIWTKNWKHMIYDHNIMINIFRQNFYFKCYDLYAYCYYSKNSIVLLSNRYKKSNDYKSKISGIILKYYIEPLIKALKINLFVKVDLYLKKNLIYAYTFLTTEDKKKLLNMEIFIKYCKKNYLVFSI